MSEVPFLSLSNATIDDLYAAAAATGADLGPSTMVHIDAEGADSRYVQYVLRSPERSKDKTDGVALVISIWANGREHRLARPILVAAGAGMADPRQPYNYLDLVRALRAARLKTNDYVPGEPEGMTLDALAQFHRVSTRLFGE